jgi:hypothetical protein
MKQVNPKRFRKQPEDIAFEAMSMPDAPVAPTPERTSVCADVRTYEQTYAPPAGQPAENTYTIQVPQKRRLIRHSFNIFEDHLEALKLIQIAQRDGENILTLSDMAQTAFDAFIHEQIEKQANLKLRQLS